MGASGWDYSVAYQADLSAALAALRQKVFDDRSYYWPDDLSPDRPWPQTWDELSADEQVQEEGTHSILDVNRVIGPDEPDAFGAVRQFSPAEVQDHFGTDRPTRAAFELAYRSPALSDGCPQWSGRCLVLYDGEQPSGIVFWGVSGD